MSTGTMSILGPLQVMHEALDYHLARQNLLTSNLAQVDTPQYRAQELYRTDGFAQTLATELNVTDARHMGGSARPANWRVESDENAPIGPDGNSVNLDREAVKIASNNLRYDAVTTMTRGKLEDLLWAARDGR